MLSRLYSDSVFSYENEVRGEIPSSAPSCKFSLDRLSELRSTFDDAGERRRGDRTGSVRVRGTIDGQFDIIPSYACTYESNRNNLYHFQLLMAAL
jgi:hypothetical protein